MELVIAWLALIFVGAAVYVLVRFTSARNRGEDANAAGRGALVDVLPVLGAGIAGVVIFFGIATVILFLLVVLFFAAAGGGGDNLALVILGLTVLGLGVLVGLPVAAIAAVRRRRRG